MARERNEKLTALRSALAAERAAGEAEQFSIRAIQAINAARSARWMAGSPGWTTLEIAGELAGEVGELANVCKKLRRSEMGVPGNKVSDDELRQQARGEIADVFIVLMLTASKLGIDLEDAVRDTFNKKSVDMGFRERIAARALAADVASCPHDAITIETVNIAPSTSAVSFPMPPFQRTRCTRCGAIRLATGEWRRALAADRETEE